MLRRAVRWGGFIAVLAAVMGHLLACSEQFSKAEDGLGSTVERIEQNVLPPLVDETGVVLRNYLNLLPLLVEICATPVGELGEFTSQLPELQRPQQQVGDTFTLNDTNGFWQAAWRDVIFGDQDGQLTVDAGTPGVDVTVTAQFRTAGLASVRAVPFALPSRELVQTSREPGDLHTCTEATPEGFYLFQDRVTGIWTLAWCARETNKVFQGNLAASAFSRVSRKASSETAEEVESLSVGGSSSTLQFQEITAPMVAEGIRFFVQPGEFISFELRIGEVGGDLESITREDLRLGVFNADEEQFLPSNLNAANFQLVTSVPIVPTGKPDVTLRQDFATFVWRDEVLGPCTEAGETLWHLRFHTAEPVMFSGTVNLADEDASNRRLRVFRVGRCQEGLFEFENNDEQLTYECAVEDVAENGYDICVSGARRVQFSPAVEVVRDPTRVWIGSESHRPPAQDPFSMLYELEILERRSARNFNLTNSRVILVGTTLEGNSIPLNEEQVSLEALCQSLDDAPRNVRLIGNGDYGTTRFEGSRYEFTDLEFSDALRTSDVVAQRLPDRGSLELRTRDGLDEVEIIVPAPRFADTNGRVTAALDLTLTLNTLLLDFFDRPAAISLK